jgi:outer membrane protein insertion porin family
VGSVTSIRLGQFGHSLQLRDLTKRLSLHSMAKGLAPGRRGERLRWLLAVLLYAGSCWAQEIPTPSNLLPSYEGQQVSTIELAGRPDLSKEDAKLLQSLIKQKQGQPFSLDDINASIAALKNSELVKDVRLDVTPEANGIRVSFVLQPAYYIGMYQFPGALHVYSYSRLLQISNYPMQGPYSPVAVANAQSALAQHFRRGGFFQSQVTTSLDLDREHHVVNVIFPTDLNRRANFGNLTITGTTPEEAARLEKSVQSRMARIRRVAIREGKPYSYGRLQSAEQYFQRQLAGRGYLSAQVKLDSSNYTAEGNRADVTFSVTKGPKINVKVVGARLSGRARRRLIPIYQEDLFTDEMAEEGRQNLLSHFQSRGNFDAKVDLKVDRQPSVIDVLYDVKSGQRHRVVSVGLRGNHAISIDALMPNVAVKKKRFWFSRGSFSDDLVQTSVNNIRGVYRNAGFSQVAVTSDVKRPNGDVAVTFEITEGPRDTVQSFAIEGNTLPVSQLAPNGLHIGPGKPYSPFLVNQDRNQVISQYLSRGYLTATFTASATPKSRRSRDYDVIYQIHEGQQVKTAKVLTLGRQQTKQHIVDTTVKMRPGYPISEDQLLSAESRLFGLGIFDWAEVDPKRTVIDQDSEDVLIKLHEAKRNTINYGFGFEVINRGGSVPGGTVAVPGVPPVGVPSSFVTSERTFWGPRGLIDYTRKNLRGTAESMTVGGFAGRLDQRAYSNYIIPSFRGSSWSVNTNVLFEHDSENPVFTDLILRYALEFRKPLDAKRTKTVFLRYQLQRTDITQLLIPELVPPGQENVRLSTLSASYIRDTRDNPLDAHKGIYQSYEAGVTATAIGATVNFWRMLGQTAYYKNIGYDNIIWANNIRIGVEQAFAGSVVPLSEEFFTGGGSTLRGYPLNGAGPQRVVLACGDPSVPSTCSNIQVPTGGNGLFIFNSEFRIPVSRIRKGFGVVGFYDGGNVFPAAAFNDFAANYSNTIGFGLRYATPVGPIRFDVGHNLNPIPGIKSTQIFVTLGQAF